MRRRDAVDGECGSATVMVVLTVPLVLLLLVFAVDVGNWFVHKRHLQTQADAAALAGGGVYTFPICDDTLITDTANRYSGAGDPVAKYNDPAEVGTPSSRLFTEINKPTYKDQPSRPNPADADLPGLPCDKKFVDVKMTEKDVPLFFDTHLIRPTINAQARVKLFQTESGEGLLPLGVQEATPKKVRAYVIDEATGVQVPGASVELVSHGSTGGIAQFDNDAAPLSFAVPAGTSSLGVRVALSGTDSSTTCGAPLVNCYDLTATNLGLHYLRTWSDQPAPASAQPPIARSVYLSPGTCGNGSFNAKPTSCSFDVNAKVSWNSAIGAAELKPGTTSRTKLTVGYRGNDYAMTYLPATSTWTVTGIPNPAGTIGPRDIAIAYEQQVGKVSGDTCTTNNPKKSKCIGSFGVVQRTYWNNPDDQSSRGGPISQLDVLDASTLTQVSDLQRCSTTHTTCNPKLIFQVGIKGSLALDAAGDPPRSMRVAGTGSQNQTLDCDPARGFVDEIAYGCQPRYDRNHGTACSAPTTPPSCVPVQTGTTANKPAQGFNTRFLCAPAGNPGNCGGSAGNWDGKPSTCPPAGQFGHNNWPTKTPGDPRIVAVFLVPFGTFQSSGNQLVPIIDFGAFYVTGWASNGAGFANPCIGNGDQFAPGTAGDNGVISGHFVKNVGPNTVGSATETCDFNDLGQCVAVLVK